MNISKSIGPIIAFLGASGLLILVIVLLKNSNNINTVGAFLVAVLLTIVTSVFRVLVLKITRTAFACIGIGLIGFMTTMGNEPYGSYSHIIIGAITTAMVVIAFGFKYIDTKIGYFPAYVVGVIATIIWISTSCTFVPKDTLWYNITADCSSDGSLCTDSGLAGVRNTGITFIPLGIQVPEDRFIIVPSLRKEINFRILTNQKIPYGYECVDNTGCHGAIEKKETEIFIVKPHRYSDYRAMQETFAKIPEPLVIYVNSAMSEYSSVRDEFIKSTKLSQDEVE